MSSAPRAARCAPGCAMPWSSAASGGSVWIGVGRWAWWVVGSFESSDRPGHGMRVTS